MGELVEQLSSNDPAARLLAIRSLERLTGETFGYEHAGPEWARREAIGRWVSYVEGLEAGEAGLDGGVGGEGG